MCFDQRSGLNIAYASLFMLNIRKRARPITVPSFSETSLIEFVFFLERSRIFPTNSRTFILPDQKVQTLTVDHTYLLILMLDNRLGLFNPLHFKLSLFSLCSFYFGIPSRVGFLELGFKKPRTLEELIPVIVLLCLHILPLDTRMFTPAFWIPNLLYSEICTQG